MSAYSAGQAFRLFEGSVVRVLGVRQVPRYTRGETETRAGREPIRVRLDDAFVYECELEGVRYENSEAEMHVLARGSEPMDASQDDQA